MNPSETLPALVSDLVTWTIVGFISMICILHSYAYGRARVLPPRSVVAISLTLGAVVAVGLYVSGRLMGILDVGSGQPVSLLTIIAVSNVAPYWIAYSRLFERTFLHIDSLIARAWDPASDQLYRYREARPWDRSPAASESRTDSGGGTRRGRW